MNDPESERWERQFLAAQITKIVEGSAKVKYADFTQAKAEFADWVLDNMFGMHEGVNAKSLLEVARCEATESGFMLRFRQRLDAMSSGHIGMLYTLLGTCDGSQVNPGDEAMPRSDEPRRAPTAESEATVGVWGYTNGLVGRTSQAGGAQS